VLKRGEILTIPNAITGVRALGIPLFLWAYLSVENTGLALTILIIGAVSTEKLQGFLIKNQL